MTSRRSAALIALILLMIAWGSTFVVTKAAVAEIPPLTLSVLRFLIASAVLVPIALARGGLARLPRPLPIAAIVLMGVTGIALFHIAFNYGLLYASATQGALILALAPAAIALAAVLVLKEAPSRMRLAGIALSIGGVALVIAGGAPSGAAPRPLLGALFMVGAVIVWTWYTIIAKRLAGADQIVVIAAATLIGALIQLPFAALELATVPWTIPSSQGWLGALFLGLIASALGFVVYSLVLRELDASLVGAFLNLDPIIGVLTAVLLLGETLGPAQALGGAVALAGMWLASAGNERANP